MGQLSINKKLGSVCFTSITVFFISVFTMSPAPVLNRSRFDPRASNFSDLKNSRFEFEIQLLETVKLFYDITVIPYSFLLATGKTPGYCLSHNFSTHCIFERFKPISVGKKVI